MNNQLFIHLYVNKINSNIFKLFINFQYLFKLLFYMHTHIHIYIYIFLIEVSQFLLLRKKRDCINLSLSLSLLLVFSRAVGKKKKERKEGDETGGKSGDNFSRLAVKRWRDHRDDYWALLGPGCDRTSEWVMLYCLRRPCGVSDRPSAPLNSTCLSMLCAAYLRAYG